MSGRPLPRGLVDAVTLVAGHLEADADTRLAAEGQLVKWGFVADPGSEDGFPCRAIEDDAASDRQGHDGSREPGCDEPQDL